jgi:hypothetical protein
MISVSDFDHLVPDAQARREFGGVCAMTFWRWDRNPAMTELGWLPPIKIGRRNYRGRQAIEAFKTSLIKKTSMAQDSSS